MGYPEFLKKYISYSLPEEQKRVQQTVKQMSNFPRPLSKYLGGGVELGSAKQQPTMGELGYLQQKSPELAYSREFEQAISALPPEKRLDYVKSQSFWFNRLSRDIGDWFKKHIPKASPKTQNLLNKASDIAGYIAVPVTIATGTLAGLGMLEASAPYAYSENPVLRTVGKVGERIQIGRISLQKIQQTAAQYKEALQTFKKLGARPDINGYRKLIKTYHPDINPSYSELASKINDSYQTIETVNKMKKSTGLITKILSYFVKSAPNLPLHSLPESIKEPAENATKIINELQKVKDPETVKIFGTTPVTPASLAKYASKLEGNFQIIKSDIPKLLQPIETELIQPSSGKVSEPSSGKVSEISPITEHISDFEQKELIKKGLTGLQPTEGYIYVGIRNPKTLEKIKQSGKLKVDRTSEKMGIFATPYISIANDYAKRTGVILKIPFTEDLKKAVIPDKIDKRLKQVRINKDIDLSNALIKQGDKWEKFKKLQPKVVEKPQSVKTISTKKTKQPWEMTREEFLKEQERKIKREIRQIKSIPKEQYKKEHRGSSPVADIDILEKELKAIKTAYRTKVYDEDAFIPYKDWGIVAGKKAYETFHTENPIREHKEAIEKALKAGKPVPPEVLKEYPDLEKKYKAIAKEEPSLSEKKDIYWPYYKAGKITEDRVQPLAKKFFSYLTQLGDKEDIEGILENHFIRNRPDEKLSQEDLKNINYILKAALDLRKRYSSMSSTEAVEHIINRTNLDTFVSKPKIKEEYTDKHDIQGNITDLIKVTPSDGYTAVQKEFFVKALLKARDKLLRKEYPSLKNIEIPYFTDKDVDLLEQAETYNLPKPKVVGLKKLEKRGFVKETEKNRFELTKLGEVIVKAAKNRNITQDKENKIYIKVPDDGRFIINYNLKSINKMLEALKVRPLAPQTDLGKVEVKKINDLSEIYVGKEKKPLKEIAKPVYLLKYKGIDAILFRVNRAVRNYYPLLEKEKGWIALEKKTGLLLPVQGTSLKDVTEKTVKIIDKNEEKIKRIIAGNKPKSQPVAQENPFSKLKTYQKVVKNMGYTPEQVMQEFEKSKKTDEDILKARKKLVDFTHQIKLTFSDREARKFDKFIHEKYLSKLKSGSLLKVLDERVKQKVEEAEYPKDVENKPGYADTHIVSKLLDGIKTIVNKTHDWIIAYGELRRTNPEAYDKFITAVDKAAGTLKVELIKLQKKLKPFENKVTGKDLTLMATAIEEGKTPEEAFPDNKIAQKLMKVLIEENEALEKIKKEYHITSDFRESYMAALDNEIEKLEKSKKADDVAEAQYLQELREQVEKMRYEPRSLLVSKILSSRNSTEFVKKIKNLNALQSSYKHRKGVSMLAEWIDKGIVKPEEVNAIALTALNRVETTTKLIWRKMYQDFEKDGLIRKATPELKEMGWVPADKIGIRDRYLNKKLIQPGLARAFAEYINSQKPASVFDRILGIIKVGNFIKPTIIWKYDLIQASMRGLYSLNPYIDAKVMGQAIHCVQTKDEFYQKLVKSGVLAGSGMEPGKRQLDREIEVFAKQYPKEYSKLAKVVRKILGRQNIIVDNKSIGKTALNIATFYTDALSNITWTGDEVFRVFGVLMAERMGYSEKEAMAIAKCAFGDYNLLSNSYKRAMHKVFFVYAFRMLMPMEMSKTLFTEPTRAILRTIHGEKVPKYEIERILKGILMFFGIIFAVDWYFRKKKGMKPIGHHLGKLAWGYGKTVVENGKKKQIVYKTNYILNMFIKYWNRFTTYDPTNPRSPVLQVIGRVLNWEIQPAYRIGIEIAYNRPSFGNRKYVYDPSDPPSKQIGEILLYAFEQSFRVFSVMDDILSTDDRVQYAKDQQRIINKHFGVLDKMIMNMFGYTYVRSGDTQRYMLSKLNTAYKKRINEIMRDYPNNPEKRRKMIENAKAWAKRSREYIIKHYPKN